MHMKPAIPADQRQPITLGQIVPGFGQLRAMERQVQPRKPLEKAVAPPEQPTPVQSASVSEPDPTPTPRSATSTPIAAPESLAVGPRAMPPEPTAPTESPRLVAPVEEISQVAGEPELRTKIHTEGPATVDKSSTTKADPWPGTRQPTGDTWRKLRILNRLQDVAEEEGLSAVELREMFCWLTDEGCGGTAL